MAGKRSLFFRNLQSVLKKVGKPVAYSLLVATAMLCTILLPVLEKAIASPPSYSTAAASAQTQDLLNQGKKRFDEGQYEAAVQDLLQAVKVAQINKDTLAQAIALSNLALAYEQLGQWDETNEKIEQSLKLLQAQKTGASLPVLAQALDVQGNLQKAQGQTENALKTWQQAATIYTQLEDNNSLIRNRLDQAQALQTLGSYKQALEILEEVGKVLENQPNSLDKVRSLRSLGDAYQAVGRLEEAREKLKGSLLLAKVQDSKRDVSPIYFSLGNLVRAEISQAPPKS